MKAQARIIPIPLWIGLLVAVPLAVLFLLSLAAAAAFVAVAGAAYWLLAPRRTPHLSRPRRDPRVRGVEIELDSRDFHRLPDERQRR